MEKRDTALGARTRTSQDHTGVQQHWCTHVQGTHPLQSPILVTHGCYPWQVGQSQRIRTPSTPRRRSLSASSPHYQLAMCDSRAHPEGRDKSPGLRARFTRVYTQ